MHNKKNIQTRLTAVLLSLIMIITVCPMSVWAVDDLSGRIEENISEDQVINGDIIDKETEEYASSLKEDISLRDKFSKHYIDPDGKRYAVVFPEQVHYLEQGSWVEVDNRLVFNETAKKYVSENPKFKTQFAQSSGDGNLVSVDDGNYKLSWSITFGTPKVSSKLESETAKLISDVKAEVSKVSADSDEQLKTKDTISEIGKAVSEVKYNSVLGNSVDLRYSILHGKVEEDVILHSPDGFTSYTLTVDTDGLRAVGRSDNSVAFLTPEGEEVFKISAPWMKDSAGSVSDDIKVTVESEKDAALVTYTPSSEWLGDTSRVYPVLIDPSVTTRYYTSNYEDTYVYEGDSASTTRPSENTLKVGNISGKKYCAYFKILNVPELVGCSYIEEATLNFYANKASSPALNVYEVSDFWSPTTITYSNSNQFSTHLIASNQTARAVSSYSLYSIDLVGWFNGIEEDWGDIYDYFESDEWNGFKLETAANVSGSYTEIYSSENTLQARRPTITIKYAYFPDLALADGALYSFVNKASNKYLTIDSGRINNDDDEGANVYQYTKNDTRSQTFKLDYDEVSNSFQILEICSADGSEWVLEALSDNAFDRTTGEYSAVNVDAFYRGYPVDRDQGWIITHYANNYYRISLKADPHLVLTANGVVDGSPKGDLTTSAGNIYVSKFTGAASQLWKLESGGCQVLYGLRIEDESSIDISEGGTWLDFCCPVKNFGDTVDWDSDNHSVATVDSNGHVTAHKAGTATITAKIGSRESYECTVYVTISNDVYWFSNKQIDCNLELPGNDSYTENEKIEVHYSGIGTPDSLYQIFKVNYLGCGKYSIRSMFDNSMGWTESGTSLVCDTIGTSDSSVPLNSQWEIISVENGYYFKNVATNKCVTCPADPNENNYVNFELYSSSNQLQILTVNKITKAYNGITLKDKVDTLLVGDSKMFTAGVYSTYDNVFGQNGFNWSVTNETGKATINPTTGVLTGESAGSVSVNVTYRRNSYDVFSKSYKVYIILEDGAYFIKNNHYRKYAQTGKVNNNSDKTIELADFNNTDYHQWTFKYVGSGYYKITFNNSNNYAVTVPSGSETKSNVDLILKKYAESENQKWEIISTRPGYYKLKAVSSKSYTAQDLALISVISSGSTIIQQGKYVNDSDYSDEWQILLIPNAYSIGGIFGDAEIADTANDWKYCGYLSKYETDPQKYDLNQDNLNSPIVYLSGHGTQHYINLGNNIYLSDGLVAPPGDYEKITDFTLDTAKLFIFDACSTASDTDETGNNLCTQTLAAGAECVIGWKNAIDAIDAVAWQSKFREKLIAGCTVEEAVKQAHKNEDYTYYDYDSIVKSCTIYGNGNLIIQTIDSSINSANNFYNDNDMDILEESISAKFAERCIFQRICII